MRLSQKAIDDFKKIYFQTYGRQLSNDEANKKGIELLHLFIIVYKPIPKDDKQFFEKLTND